MKHIGHELALMLAGKKALAGFCYFAGENIDPTGGQDFASAVENGQIGVKRFFAKHPSGRRLVYTVYYRPGEEWRFEQYKALKQSAHRGWNVDKEVIESILLDYDRESLDAYLSLLGRRP